MSTKKTTASVSATAADIIAGGDSAVEPISLPIKKNGKAAVAYLLPLSAGAVVDFIADSPDIKRDDDGTFSVKDPRGAQNAMLRLIARHLCNENGNLLFDPDDASSLSKIPMVVFNHLQKVLTEKIVEDSAAAKNAFSEVPAIVATTTGASRIDSPSSSVSTT